MRINKLRFSAEKERKKTWKHTKFIRNKFNVQMRFFVPSIYDCHVSAICCCEQRAPLCCYEGKVERTHFCASRQRKQKTAQNKASNITHNSTANEITDYERASKSCERAFIQFNKRNCSDLQIYCQAARNVLIAPRYHRRKFIGSSSQPRVLRASMHIRAHPIYSILQIQTAEWEFRKQTIHKRS